MRKIACCLLGSAILLSVSTPALAGPDHGGYQSNNRHDRQHQKLERKHDRGDYALGRQHAEAHEYYLSRQEHRGVHRQLQRQHQRNHNRIEYRHDEQHDRDNHD